jgi:hypothetical protein
MEGAMGSTMSSTMGWMMGLGALGWIVAIVLLAGVVVVLVRLISH